MLQIVNFVHSMLKSSVQVIKNEKRTIFCIFTYNLSLYFSATALHIMKLTVPLMKY